MNSGSITQLEPPVSPEKSEPLVVIKNEPPESETMEIAMDDIFNTSDSKDIDIVSHTLCEGLIKSETISENVFETGFVKTENIIESENLIKTEDTSDDNGQEVVEVQGNLETDKQQALNFSNNLNSVRSPKPKHPKKTDFSECNIKVIRLSPVIPVKSHEYTTLATNKHVCNHCQLTCKKLDILRAHIRTKHREVTTMYQCFYCSFKSKWRPSVRVHIMYKHKGTRDNLKYHYCDKCDYKTYYTGNLKTHKIIHLKPKEIQYFYCHHCSYKSKYNENLKCHVLMHENVENEHLNRQSPSAAAAAYLEPGPSHSHSEEINIADHSLSVWDLSDPHITSEADIESTETAYNDLTCPSTSSSPTHIDQIFLPKETALKKQETTTNAIVNMIIKDMLPLSFVEGPGFIEFIKKTIPFYTIPCRNTIKNRISLIYDVEKHEIMNEVAKFDWVSLTTDCWSSRNNESYITVTMHAISKQWKHVKYTLATEIMEDRYTAENLRNKIEEIISAWNLTGKVCSVVYDNTALKKLREVKEYESVCCFAHTLQLCINKGLDVENIRQLLTKCSAIVGHYKHSNVAAKALREAQNHIGLPNHQLIQRVKTRWNSVYYMVERLVEQRQALINVLQNRRFELKESDWDLLEALTACLKPFTLTTAIMSSGNSPTISIVLPIVQSLLDNFLKPDDEFALDEIKSFKGVVSKQLRSRFDCNDTVGICQTRAVKLHDIAIFLDPRYKMHESSFGIILKTKSKIKQLLSQTAIVTVPQDEPMTSPSLSQTAIDFLFPRKQDKTSTLQDPVVREIEIYSKENQIDKNASPLDWWKRNEPRFPLVGQLARKYLAIPATSTPSERVFSDAGNIVSAKRSCLEGNAVNMLVFLNSLKNEVKE